MGDLRFEELIVRKRDGQEDSQIIFGERRSEVGVVGGTAMQRKDAQSAADLRAVECGGFAGGESAEFPGTALDEVARKMICESGGAGAGARGIGENMKVGERTGFDELQGGGVIGAGFAGEASDDIGADGGVWQMVVDEFDAAGVVLGPIPAMHGGEDAIRGGLQRHVEVRSDAIGDGKEFDEVLGDVEGFDGADAQALDGGFVKDAAEEIEKFDARGEVAAVGAQIDAAENDFAKTGVSEALYFGEHGLRRQAAGFAANEWNHTEGAAGVAAILDFEGGACVISFPAEDGGDKDFGKVGDFADEDGRRDGG